MVRIASAEEMRRLDRETVSGISAELLMENAGQSTAAWLGRAFAPKTRFVCVCGAGNNGGDGFVAARHLAKMGFRPRVVFVGDLGKAAPLCRKNHDWLLDYLPGSVAPWTGELPPDADVIIDALLGLGARGAVREPAASCIRAMNSSGLPVVSLDVPSGLSAMEDVPSEADLLVKAAYTLTFGHAKCGMQLPPTREFCGKIVILDIFFPDSQSERILAPRWWATASSIRDFLPPRPLAAHKGKMGKLLIIAGSSSYAGAAVLTARGALASGTGLVHLAVPDAIAARLPNLPADSILHAIPDGGLGHFGEASSDTLMELSQGMTALVIGPGLGAHEASQRLVRRLLAACDRPIVLDADALAVLRPSAAAAFEGKLPPQTVCTPHYGEFARLCPPAASLSDGPARGSRERDALALAARTNAHILVKDASNLVATPDGECYWLTSGSPSLARGGMGDVLAGYLGGFLARGMAPLHAALLACWLHGASAHRAERRYGQDGVTAERLADMLALSSALLEKGRLAVPGEPIHCTGV